MKKALSLILTAVMLLGVLSVFTIVPVSAATWTAEKPKGSGTQEDPYLIATPGNFYWIQANTVNPHASTVDKNGDGTKDFRPYEGSETSFVGVYFEQVCDIDFEGAEMNAIGEYICDTNNATTDTSKEIGKIYGGFGGNYNGNGFALKNLKVKYNSQINKTNHNWCTGLFSVIYGATLRNMVLENVDVVSTNPCSGILVGKAYAPTYLATYNEDTSAWSKAVHPDASKTDFNVIENITIDGDSSITAARTTAESALTVGNWAQGINVGSIVGTAVGTTIRNCTNNATIKAGMSATCVGGLIGGLGNSTVVENCINNGNIEFSNIEGATKNGSNEKGFGGIIGIIIGNSYSHEIIYRVAGTGVRVANCVNNGGITMAVDGASSDYWGGIVGGINAIGVAANGTYVLEDCYNTAAPSNNNLQRFAGIIGVGFIGNGATADTLHIKNCLSVDVAQKSNYCEINEAVVPNTEGNSRKTKDGKYPLTLEGVNAYYADGTSCLNVNKNTDGLTGASDTGATYATRALTDYIYVAKADGTGYELSTTTKFQDLVDAIESDIALAQAYGKTVVALGYQEGLDDGVNNNAGAYRLIFGLHKTEYRNVGVSVAKTVEGGATTFANVASDVVYKSVYAYVDGEETKVDADDLGVDYLTTLTINDIPASGTVTYTITTYVTNRDTAKTLTKGDIIEVKFTNGALVSAEIK